MAKTGCKNRRALTFVELLVALMVSAVILAAVGTLAYAMGSANDAADDTSWKQAQVRLATVRITELIRNCKLILKSDSGHTIAIWRADDNDDGLVNMNEVVYIDSGPGSDYLRICELFASGNPQINPNTIQSFGTNWWGGHGGSMTDTVLIAQCSGVQFRFDVSPPLTRSKFVSILFNLSENGVVRQYQINAALRSWGGHMLDGGGAVRISDDD